MNKCKNINGIIIYLKSFKRIKVIGHLSTHFGYLFIYLFLGGGDYNLSFNWYI